MIGPLGERAQATVGALPMLTAPIADTLLLLPSGVLWHRRAQEPASSVVTCS